MQQTVLIQIQSTQEANGDRQTMEMITQGQMQVCGSQIMLTYEEAAENGRVTTILTDSSRRPGQVELMRTGGGDGRMTIEEGRRHHSIFSLGPYECALGVYGERVDCRLNPRGGLLRLVYTLDINATYTGRNTIELSVSPAAPTPNVKERYH